MRINSIYNTKLSLDDIIEHMMRYLIDVEVRNKPYISIVSKKQLWFGDGVHFKHADDYIKKGLRANAGFRIPTDIECEKKERFYGYPALQKPWKTLNQITNKAIRNKIQLETFKGKELEDIRLLIGRGYVREDGSLDPNQTKGISVYILFMADSQFREAQNKWIQSQPMWIRYQVVRNQHTHLDILKERQRAAQKTVSDNRKLINQNEWKELDSAVDMEQIDWSEDGDQDE